jgi:hypothetical protein
VRIIIDSPTYNAYTNHRKTSYKSKGKKNFLSLYVRPPIAFAVQPSRSPDFKPLHVFLWGHLKSVVHSVQIGKRERERETSPTHFTCLTNHSQPSCDFWNGVKSRIRREHTYIGSDGRYFEHLLWIVSWCTIGKKQLLNWERVL